MGNDEEREVFTEAFNGLHDSLFGLVVQCTGCFVKDDDSSLPVEGADDADALTLTTKEADAALTDKCLVLLGPAFNTIGNLRFLCGLPNALGVNLIFGYAKGNVFSTVLSARNVFCGT